MVSLDKKEGIRLFIRENLSLFKGPFLEAEYRERKRQFFIDKPKSGVGNPRDTEVVDELIDYLIDIRYLQAEEDLDKLLANPFLKEKSFRAEEYREKLRESPQVTDGFDPSKIRSKEYAKTYRDKVKMELIDQEKENILKGVESSLFSSVLDTDVSTEPEVVKKLTEPQTILLWWQELNLESDPFPSEEGLADIADKYYDEIVCRTEIFKKYLDMLSMSTGEVLKNSLFFGDFGTGKTTFFDYLKKAMQSQPSLHPMYIQLLAEPDPYAMLAKFKIKFLEELKSIFRLLEKRAPELAFETYDPDPISTQIYQVSTQLAEAFHSEGLVTFIDDLHKLEFGQTSAKTFWAITTFLSSLQIFKAEFSRRTPLKLAFYVAAVPSWENKFRSTSALSGSFSRYDPMPAVTIEDATEMLNRRFAAFAQNKQNPEQIDENLVRRVYNRSREANEPITWRSFIKSIVNDELRQKHYTVLQAAPLSLSEEKKNAIRLTIESDPAVKGQINSLLYGPITSPENRIECLKRLGEIHLKGFLPETTLSGLLGEERYYYKRLESARLIRKRILNGQHVFTVSPELRNVNEKIVERFNLSMEEYLPSIYGTQQLITTKGEKIVVELNQLEELAKRVQDAATKTLLKDAAANYNLVLSRLNDFTQPVDRKLIEAAIHSITSLTRAWILIEDVQKPDQDGWTLENVQEFWTENWCIPSALGEFFKALGTDLLSESELRYAVKSYIQAFADIVARLSKLNESCGRLHLSHNKLTRREMEVLARSREDLLNGKYMPAMRESTDLVESRLRTFCFNTFSLLYGGPEKRRRRINDDIAKYMQKTGQGHGYTETNEFELLNRGQYKIIIAGNDNKGVLNWSEIFRYVFKPRTELAVLDFLNRFAETNVKTSHQVSSAFQAQDTNEMWRYLGDCVTFLEAMNSAYQKLVSNWYYHEKIEADHQTAHYFCLHSYPAYRPALTPVLIPRDKEEQLVREFRSKIKVTPIIDLSDWQYIRTVFNCEYRQFVALLAASLEATSRGTSDVGISVSKWFGSEVKLEFHQDRN